ISSCPSKRWRIGRSRATWRLKEPCGRRRKSARSGCGKQSIAAPISSSTEKSSQRGSSSKAPPPWTVWGASVASLRERTTRASSARGQARVGQVRVSVCDGGDDQVYFAVSTDITLPLEARFSRLVGQVGGFPFQAAGTGEVVVDEATARLEPTLLQVLGGQME